MIGSQRHTPKSRDLYGMLKNWLPDQNKMVDDTSPYISLILGMGTSLTSAKHSTNQKSGNICFHKPGSKKWKLAKNGQNFKALWNRW